MDLRVRKLKNIELNRLSPEAFKNHENKDLVMILDNVRSLNNVGSIFRTCDCLGISKLYLCGITGTPPHRDIYKTSLGAEETVQWEYYANIADLIQKLQANNYYVVGLEQTDHSVDLRNFNSEGKKVALIAGNEIEGLSDSSLELCDGFIEIPQFGTKHSFNVAVSAGIALWELGKAGFK